MLRSTRNLLRLIVIARTLAHHDALFPLAWLPATGGLVVLARLLNLFRVDPGVRDRRAGERLALALEALGPSFIKAGQALSTRSDLVGEEIAADLTSLQDRLPPFSGAAARAVIEAELGRPIDELFASFESEATAAASIAQVHFATVRLPAQAAHDATGAPEAAANPDEPTEIAVAVKILRPGVEKAFERDLDLLRWLAALVERTQPRLRRLRPIAAVETFAETVRLEMDLRMEASAAAELAENFADDPAYLVPRIDWERTARRVMTSERIRGIPVHDIAALAAAGHDFEDLVRRASEAFFRQVFRDGFFHADMHPGNLFVGPDGALIPVDFGIMGRIDRPTRNYLADMLLGFLTRDYDRVADVHFRAGYVPAHQSRDNFKQAARAIAEPILDRPTSEISIARLLAQLFQVTEQFEMETQPQLLLLQKTMLLAEGVGRSLAPHANMWALAQPLVEGWMIENRGPEARLADFAADTLLTLERLPRAVAEVERAARAIADGTIRIESGRVRQRLWLWTIPAALVAFLLGLALG
jgi:ubiquinone biosynthesis protein